MATEATRATSIGLGGVVIVGLGGIVGASVAHHLIERGWDDIVGIDKSGIPTDIGSTSHASDFCYATSHDFLSCWTTLYSIDFFEKIAVFKARGIRLCLLAIQPFLDFSPNIDDFPIFDHLLRQFVQKFLF